MRRVRWTVPALEDLAAIDAYWWENAPSRADLILDRIEAAAAFLKDLPHAGPELEELQVRKWVISRTDYLLFYRFRNDEVEILRIRHGRENWQTLS
jgi:plasmid stabilization system protein ParE